MARIIKSPVLTYLLIVGLLGGSACLGAEPSKQPNIIFIMADDLGYGDLSCYGQQQIQTPNIDRLAAEGMRFTQTYAGGPVCTSSRSVLMTGLHNGHTPARDNVPHYTTYLRDEDVTLAEVLQQAGYRTGGIGKWSLGDAGTVGRATNQGFDEWYGYLNQDHAHFYYTEYLDDGEGRHELTGNRQSRHAYSHDLMTQRGLEFIERARDDRRPFFLYAAFTLPHFAAQQEDPDGLTVPTTEPYQDRNWDERSKKYAAMIHRLDTDVGRIVQLVDNLGLGQDTLILFTSDNGGHDSVPEGFRTSGPLRGFKRELTEGGIRVPFIARWPNTIAQGLVSSQVIAFQDMLPTFAELADAAVPAGLDGVSIASSLQGNPRHPVQTPRRDFLYWDYGHCRQRYDQAVRWQDWKGIRLGINGSIQLYDLQTDIGETRDLAAEYPEVVEHIAHIMATATVPSEKYPIGTLYRGSPIWKTGQ